MKNLKELFEIAKASMEQQKDFVFVTVIASSGSPPEAPVPACWCCRTEPLLAP